MSAAQNGLDQSDGSKAFNPIICTEYFSTCLKNQNDIPIESFLLGCEEIKKILSMLGPALAIASADITEKVGVIRTRVSEIKIVCSNNSQLPSEDTSSGKQVGPYRDTLHWMVRYEIEKGVANRNDKHYVSGARSLLRLMWFLDFLYTMLHNMLIRSKDETLQQNASKAYDVALAPHHPWVLRKTISLALTLLPSKETFLKNLADPTGIPLDEFKEKMSSFVDTLNPVREELWNFYRANNIQDLQ